jgi:hypothetical protein
MPDPHSAQRPSTPHCDCRRDPVPPSKSRDSSPLAEGRKEVIGTTTRPLQGVTYPAYHSLRNTAGTPGEKNLKTITIAAQGIKTLIKNNFRCVNLNEE